MNICIVHDSKHGNGKKVAEAMKQVFETSGATVALGHVTELSPEAVADLEPELVVVGAAVRMFQVSKASKRWLRQLDRALLGQNRKIPHGAVFLSHAMDAKACKGWGGRLLRRMERARSISHAYPQWFSAHVLAPEGPLEDGTIAEFEEHSEVLLTWMGSEK